MTFELGQTLWLHFTQRSIGAGLRPYTVTKIGRKWVTLGNYRIDATAGFGVGRHQPA